MLIRVDSLVRRGSVLLREVKCVQVLGSKRAVRGLIWWIGGIVFGGNIIMREEEMRGSIS